MRRFQNASISAFSLLIALRLTAPASMFSQSAGLDTNGVAAGGDMGDEVCARCHAAIYRSYKRTPMAHASGPAAENLVPGEFIHKPSGVHYRIYTQDGQAWLSFDRPGDPFVNGKRRLLYYIGSGHRGRSYLFATDGFLFESPVNWYSDEKVWDAAPAYQDAHQIQLNLPAYPSCLNCHTSGMRPPLQGTDNRYPSPPFAFDGVACERCHGPGAAHVSAMERTAGALHNSDAAIINPIKLSPERRDSVCMQCHLEAAAAIERQGRHAYDFRAGDLLSDYVRYYVITGAQQARSGAVSQFEALTQSLCKRKSGDDMSCMSCHDPHASPAPEQRVAYYRGKCLACHVGNIFATKHHPEQADCTACHMPRSLSADIAHTEVTDHRIPRWPDLRAAERSTDAYPPRLTPFPSEVSQSDIRDLALAWESLAESGMKGAAPEAEKSLRLAAEQAPSDPVLLSAMGYLEQTSGDRARARDLYREALALDPDLIDAAANLGVLEAGDGNFRAALDLWQNAFHRAPAKSVIGINITRILCETGQFDAARLTDLRVLEFDPDLPVAKSWIESLNRTPPACAGM